MKSCFPDLEPRLIAIVGGSGAGKSWLADKLQTQFGKAAARLSLDSFYLDRSHLPLARRDQVNFDHPRSVDWPLFETILRSCRAGRPLQVPRYDFARHTRLAQWEWWRPKPLVLLDGLWLLQRRAVRQLVDFSIFIQCDCALQLQRRVRRDKRERGRTAASVRDQFWRCVAPMGARYVAPQARWADAVVTAPISAKEVARLVEQLGGVLGNSFGPAH